MAESRKTGAFAPYEWMLALRYLRAKRQESFVSVISGFSLVGIALGVATLIIVMSVMGGFRQQFLHSILGFNGHVTVQAMGRPLVDYDAAVARLRKVPGVTRAAPIIDGQVMATAYGVNAGIVARVGELGRRQLVLCGIESHVCVLQTAIGFRALGYEIAVAWDATSSRREADKALAAERLRAEGVTLAGVEMVLFEWLGRAGTPEFKEISALIK